MMRVSLLKWQSSAPSLWNLIYQKESNIIIKLKTLIAYNYGTFFTLKQYLKNMMEKTQHKEVLTTSNISQKKYKVVNESNIQQATDDSARLQII